MSFSLCIVFIVFVLWRPQEWLFPWLAGWPLLDVIAVMAFLTAIVEHGEFKLRIPKAMPQIPLLIGLWFASVMSHVATGYFQGMLDTIPETFKVCFFTGLLFCTLDSPSRLRTLCRVIVGMSCLMAIHAILQEKTGHGFLGHPPYVLPASPTKPAYTRSLFFGIFEDPNDMAQMLITAIPLTFAVPKRRTFMGFATSCALSYLLYRGYETGHSRGAMMGLAMSSGFMLALILPAKHMPKVMTIAVVASLIACPLSAPFMDVSSQERVVFWGMANRAFKAHLVFGVGYGMFWQVANSRAAHNAYVLCYTEMGSFGYYFWWGLLSLAFTYAYRSRVALRNAVTPEEKWLKNYSGVAIASLSAFATSSYFLSRAFVYPLFFLFAMLGCLPVVVERLRVTTKSRIEPVYMNLYRDVYLNVTLGTVVSILYIYWSIVLINKAFYGM